MIQNTSEICVWSCTVREKKVMFSDVLQIFRKVDPNLSNIWEPKIFHRHAGSFSLWTLSFRCFGLPQIQASSLAMIPEMVSRVYTLEAPENCKTLLY